MSRYYKTFNPILKCPTCNTHLQITRLQHKLWCDKCYEYVKEGKIIECFVEGVE